MRRELLLFGILILTSALMAQTKSGGSTAPAPAPTPTASGPGNQGAVAVSPTGTSTPATNGTTPATATGSAINPAANTGTPTMVPGNATSNNPAATGSPVNPAASQPIQSNGVVTPAVNASGVVATPANINQPLVTTPSVSFGTPGASTVGASNATGNNAAGASNSTLEPNNAGATGATTPQVPAAYSAAAISNVGLGGFSSAYTLGSDSGMSLAEASAHAKQKRASDRPRVITNNDIARLHQGEQNQGFNAGVSQSPPVANQNTLPASDVNAPTTPQANPPQANPKRSPFSPKAQPQQPQ